MNKRKKNQKRKAVNIENNSSSYFPKLTAISIQRELINSIMKSEFVVYRMGGSKKGDGFCLTL